MAKDPEARRSRAHRLLRGIPLERAARPAMPTALTDLQSGLWIEQALAPDSTAYSSVLALEILATVDVSAWCAALERAIGSMPFLDAIYPEAGVGGPAIAPAKTPFVVPIREGQLPDGADLAAEARRRIGQAFDLTVERPVRALFETLGPSRSVLWIAAHHIAWDGGALRELLALWEEELGQETAGARPRAGAGPVPLDPARRAVLMDKAEALFADADVAAALGLAPGVPGQPMFHSCSVDDELVRRMEALAQRCSATVNSVLVAGLAVAQRLQGISGVTVTLLVQDGMAAGFGLRRVLLPLPDVSGQNFAESVAVCRDRIRTALELTALPEADLRAAFRNATGQQTVPLGQLLLSLDREPRPPDRLAGVPVRFSDSRPDEARAPLGLSVLMPQGGSAVLLRVEAAALAGVPQDGAGFAKRYLETLAVLTADPNRVIETLPPARMVERRRLVQALHGKPLGPVPLVPELLSALDANPLAVVDGACRLSGHALRQEIDAWALRLAASGVGKGDRVVLAMPREAASVAALLALWRLGAAAILADPGSAPLAVLDSLCAAAPRAGITFPNTPLFQAFRPNRFIWLAPSAQPPKGTTPPQAVLQRDTPAYIVLTSGSTGAPAMVEISHGNLAATIAAARRFPEMPKAPRTVWSARLAFDISVLEIVLPLVLGGTVTVHRPDPPDIETLAQQASEACVFHAVPSVMAQVIEATGAQRAGPRLALVGGDKVPLTLLSRLQAVWGDSALRILYGPSETAIITLSEPVSRISDEPVIGRPHRGVRLRIVDEEGRSVPPGLPGELWIGGPVVGRYCDAGSPRAGRFVTRGGRRYFRSGDLARLTADNRIAFLGRLDAQEKIDGVRVNPEAVEAALCAQPGIGEAVVTGYGTASGRRRLAAFYIGASGVPAPQLTALQTALATLLPIAAVPARIERLDALPLNKNGKVDRLALRARAEAGNGQAVGGAMTDLQVAIAAAVEDVIGQPVTDPSQNLLALGADSIALARLNRSLGAVFGRTIPLARLMAEPSLVGIAAAFAQVGRQAALPTDSPGIAPSTPQQGLLFRIEMLLPMAPQAVIPAVFEIAPLIPFERLSRAFDECLAACDGLGLRMRQYAGGFLLERLPADVLSEGAHAQQMSLADETAAQARLKAFFAERFDLERGPPVRMLGLSVGPRSILALAAHHAVADGWALQLLLERLLRGALAAPGAGMPPSPSYLAYAQRLAQGEVGDVDAYLSHLDRTGGQAVSLFRPKQEKPRPDFVSDRCVRVMAGFGPRLDALAAQMAVTRVAIGLAAFSSVMAAEAGVSALRTALMCANRDAPGMADLVGLTANTLLVDSLPDAEATDPAEHIRATHCRLAQSLNFQQVTIQALLAHAKVQGRDPDAYTSRFQFAYVDYNTLRMDVDGVRVWALPEPEGWQREGPRFQLTGYEMRLDMRRTGPDVTLCATYLTDVFAEERARAILDRIAARLERDAGLCRETARAFR